MGGARQSPPPGSAGRHGRLCSCRDDALGALEAREVVSQLSVLPAQLLVLRRQRCCLVGGLGGVRALADIGDAHSGQGGDQRHQRQGRARTAAAEPGPARRRLVPRFFEIRAAAERLIGDTRTYSYVSRVEG